MAPSRVSFIKAQNTKKAIANSMDSKLVNSAAPSVFSKRYWDKIAKGRNAIADQRKSSNELKDSFKKSGRPDIAAKVKMKRKKNKKASVPGELYKKNMKKKNKLFGIGNKIRGAINKSPLGKIGRGMTSTNKYGDLLKDKKK